MTRTVPADHLEQVYAEHGRAMHLYAARLLGDAVAAEDVVQEALIRLWRRPEVLENDRGSVRGWLLTVVRNLVVDRARGRRARPAEVPADGGREPAGPDHADAVSASITVHRALGALSPEHRAVLEQIFLHGQDLAGAALALNIPKGTVKSRSFYALRALRELLAHDRTTEGGGR
ncbi:sigma-70 family RNA polymerase sigma factor [Pseudonocardia sp. C8]|uniref:sigma-70 family RNA polymerase sigma factor n=1 Tax=Pseudonocardia sp. C8 TaxID=2762759 RepID=UPI00351C1714